MLGSAQKPLLEQLPESGDSLDRAGTRIWAANEAVRKATDSPNSDLTIEMQTDDTVVFRSETSNKNLHTLTFPVKLTKNPERIVAVVAQTDKDKKPHISDRNEFMSVHVDMITKKYAKKLNYNLESYKVTILEGPQGHLLFSFKFPITFKESSNSSRTLYFSHYFSWLGKIREYVIEPIYEDLVRWFSTGKWSLVTNSAETHIAGEATSGDIIESRLWLAGVSGKNGSTLDFNFEWR